MTKRDKERLHRRNIAIYSGKFERQVAKAMEEFNEKSKLQTK